MKERNTVVRKKTKLADIIIFVLLFMMSLLFLVPIFVVLLNSFKGKFYISKAPFALTTSETFA